MLADKLKSVRSKAGLIGVLGAAGAGVMYFFDPDRGRGRRAQVAGRIGGLLRTMERRAERAGRHIASDAEGMRERMQHPRSTQQMPENNQVLVAKIESEVLRRANYPKGQINVDAVDGVVTLRGQVDVIDQIDAIERDVRKVVGVTEVNNLLHLPNIPAPNKQDALRSGR